jgi:putative membrane protein
MPISRLPLAALCLAAFTTGCAHEERPAGRPTVAARPSVRPSPSGAVSAATYVATASSIDLFIIGSSELAMQRSASPRVREFAQLMIDAHKGTSAQLSLEGRRLNLLPSATLDPERRAMLNELQRAADFDSVYRRQQRTIHAEALALHSNYAAQGTSPTLRPVAAAILPIIERDGRLLNYL